MQKFKDLEHLYNTVKPALKAKVSDLHRENYVMLKKEDLWNYLLEKKWILEDSLDLAIIIDDILNIDGYKISEYKNNK